MNRKRTDKERNIRLDRSNRRGEDPGRFLEYENIPDPISFDDARTIPMPPTPNRDDQDTEDEDPKPGRA